MSSDHTTSLEAIRAALRATPRADFLAVSFPNAEAFQIPATTIRRALTALKGPRFAALTITAHPAALEFRWATGRLTLTHQNGVMAKKRYHSVFKLTPVQRGAYLRLGAQSALAYGT